MGRSVQQPAASVVKKCSLFVSRLKANRTKNLELCRPLMTQRPSSNRPSIMKKISTTGQHTVLTNAKRMERATTSGRTLCAGPGRCCLVPASIKSVLLSGMMRTPRNAKINLAIAVWPSCSATAHSPSFRRLVVIRVLLITYPNNLKNAKRSKSLSSFQFFFSFDSFFF